MRTLLLTHITIGLIINIGSIMKTIHLREDII